MNQVKCCLIYQSLTDLSQFLTFSAFHSFIASTNLHLHLSTPSLLMAFMHSAFTKLDGTYDYKIPVMLAFRDVTINTVNQV